MFTQRARLPSAGLSLVCRRGGDWAPGGVHRHLRRLRNGYPGCGRWCRRCCFRAAPESARRGLTGVTPADLGPLLGLDRAPKVETLRRRLGELAGYRRGAASSPRWPPRTLRRDRTRSAPDDRQPHARVLGIRDLQKTHVAGCTWPPARPRDLVADATGDRPSSSPPRRRAAWPARSSGWPSCGPRWARTVGDADLTAAAGHPRC